jgi:hypothetical protein
MPRPTDGFRRRGVAFDADDIFAQLLSSAYG